MAYTTNSSNTTNKANRRPPTKWLMDRVTGQSKYNDQERPPGPCCWVPPCVGWCPSLLETNSICRGLGKMGSCFIASSTGNNNNNNKNNNNNGESFRFWCLHFGFVANICAMLLTAYACLSISMEYFLLSKASFETLEMKEIYIGGLTEETTIIDVYLGLRGVAINNPALVAATGQQVVVGYDQFCELSSSVEEGGFERYLDPATKDCLSCSSDYFSMNAVISLLISVATFFPTFFSQQLRMYSGYDVNCVKNYLTAIGIVTILLNVNVMLTYFFFCSKESFYEDGTTVYFDIEGNVYYNQQDELSSSSSSSSSYFYEVQYTWKWGWGLIFLVAGTSLKLIDVLCNIAVPTPNVTRDRKEQDIYETIVYASDGEDEDDEDE